ncbi:TrbI/VirB10 family protein [Phenylobacterium sp. J367]|uniref:TrbI/VirB10 family protein n=1 Tax=Phenylobacterium sp. J367 TaxID=2898435 RepID=UPI002151C340|nr:TrbI/VirB10 family protein [Phenylobacterium sp. J367]MCR5881204.1 conjugal transfer protein TrbI [Phenylobacterium sp. J367]
MTRWNRKYLIASATGLAGIVALGFYLGFGGAHAPQARPEALSDAADTGQVQTPAISTKYAAGYADPALQAQALPGTAALPPPEGAPGSLPAGTTPPPTPPGQVDPAVQAAREQALAARSSSPFFGAPPPAPAGDLAALAGPIATSAAAAGEPAVAEVQPANGQAAKRQFAANARTDDYLTNPLQPALSPWEVKAGSIISAALVTAINSDLPGQVIAQVTEPVYDHKTGRTVLIPQGSRLIGQYDSQIAYGQNRALIAWNRIIMPDGRSINIGSMAGADLSGAAGVQDKTDGHFGQLARGVILSTLFSVGAAAAQDASSRSSGAIVVNSAGSGVSNAAQQVGQQITGRDLNRQPTLRVRAGWPVRVLVSKDMILAPYP